MPALAALASCAPAEGRSLSADASVQSFRGIYRLGFENSTFDGCWLVMSAEAQAAFDGRQPESAQAGRAGGYQYEIAFEGRRRDHRAHLRPGRTEDRAAGIPFRPLSLNAFRAS